MWYGFGWRAALLTAIRKSPQSQCARCPFFGRLSGHSGIRPSLRFDAPGRQPQALFQGPAHARRRYVSFRSDGAIMTVSQAF
jgi:hypothetical protein